MSWFITQTLTHFFTGMSSTSVPMDAIPTAPEIPDPLELVYEAAEAAPAEQPQGASVLPLFIPAYSKSRGEVMKAAIPLANAKKACKFYLAFLLH